ncbi:hypothetical protein AKJ16_DCAP09063 [Drosera capensis]
MKIDMIVVVVLGLPSTPMDLYRWRHEMSVMKKDLKRKLTRMKVFEKTYTKKDTEPDEVIWSDKRSKDTLALYFILEKEIMDWLLTEREPSTKLAEEESSDAQSQTYLRATGCKKGRVYRLG